jgi:hypothetical protein
MMGAKNQPDDLDAYMNLGSKEIVRLVLLLLVEEDLRKQLAAFRAENLMAQPVAGQEELGVARNDAVPIRSRAG